MELPTPSGMAEHDPFEEHVGWRGGLAAGLIAAVVMGTGITVVQPSLLANRIAGLYGFTGSLPAGWIAHLFHGAVFGLGFSVIVADPTLAIPVHRYPGSVVAGLVYGFLLAVIAMGVILPMWLQGLGVATPPAIPYVSTALVVWHLVYGLVLGVTFSILDRW